MTAAVADMMLLAERRGVRIVATPLAREVALPAADLRRCLVALMDNAIDHSPAGGTVAVRAAEYGPNARITVTDDGSGITGIDPARVFDRFAHGSPVIEGFAGTGSSTPGSDAPGSDAPGSDTPGSPIEPGSRTRFGIGLALVAELAERHGGAVQVARTGSTGTVFELTIPFADEGASR